MICNVERIETEMARFGFLLHCSFPLSIQFYGNAEVKDTLTDVDVNAGDDSLLEMKFVVGNMDWPKDEIDLHRLKSERLITILIDKSDFAEGIMAASLSNSLSEWIIEGS